MSHEISVGDEVYDKEISSYTVVEIIERPASDVEVLPEIKDRGHTIHEAQTVAGRNPSYPADDWVVRLSVDGRNRDILWPISRVTTDGMDALSN